MGTLDTRVLFSQENQEYAIVRSIDGKIPQMTYQELDQFIVLLKQGATAQPFSNV